MSVRKGGRARAKQAAAPGLTPRADIMPFGGLGYGTMGYQGAAYSMDRGYVYWPTLDPQKEIDTWSRIEIARKAHWMVANLGLARRIRQGLINLIVGTGMIPHGTTSDSEWNTLAENAYRTRGASGLSYSVNGRLTQPQSQRLMVGTQMTDGDAAVAFASSQSGGALRQFYSGLQIRNASSTQAPGFDQEQWKDGIFYDALDRAQTYRFPDSEGSGFTDIDASNIRFLFRTEQPGQRRGMSIFAHAANKTIDVTEWGRFMMNGLKTTSEIGYYLTSSSDEKRMGIAASLGGETQQVTVTNGSGTASKVTLKQIYGQGGMIPSLPKGIDLKTLMDTRPHPNSAEFIQEFIRDICAGTGIAYELLWNICKLGGANVRYVLADAQVFVSSCQQDLVDGWLAADWAWTIAKEMKAGRLRACKDPIWWAHGWIPPARVTVDYGRDGRILLDFHKYGLLTTTRFYGMQGQTAKKEITGELELIAWRKQEMERLKLVPIDLQLYNPLLGRLPPSPTGTDYAEQVPTDENGKPIDPEHDEPIDSTTSQEDLHKSFRAIVRQELASISTP